MHLQRSALLLASAKFYSEVQQELVFDTINIWQMLSYEDIPEPML